MGNINVSSLKNENFERILKALPGICVVFCTAEWCSQCKSSENIMNGIVSSLKDRVSFFNADNKECRDLFLKENIRRMPSFIIYSNGRKLKTIEGVKTKTFIENEIKNILAPPKRRQNAFW